jgi:hypothetical protein
VPPEGPLPDGTPIPRRSPSLRLRPNDGARILIPMSDLPTDPSGVARPPVPSSPSDGSLLPPPPGEPMYSGPTTPESGPPAGIRGRSWLIALGAGLAVLLAIAVFVAVTGGKGDSLPESVGELPRLHTSEVRQFEDQMGSIKIGDVHIEVAAYGSGDRPELLLIVYSNLPPGHSIDAMLRGAGGGLIGAGGSVDLNAEITQQRDGVGYSCLPFSGRLFPDDATETSGQLCAWAEGDDVAALMDTRTADADPAITDAQAAHDALG